MELRGVKKSEGYVSVKSWEDKEKVTIVEKSSLVKRTNKLNSKIVTDRRGDDTLIKN